MLVRTYKSVAAYQQDALVMAAQGWQVANVTESRPRAGCARIFWLGLFALVFPPKPQLVVTYTNQLAAPMGQTAFLPGATVPAPSVPLPGNFAEPETPYVAYRYDGRLLGGLFAAYVLGWILTGIDSGKSTTGIAGSIGAILIILTFGAIVVFDWRGFKTLNGVVKWERMSGGQRFWMVCAYIFLFPLMLGIYLVQAAREYFYAKQPDISNVEASSGADMGALAPAPAVTASDGLPDDAVAE